MDFKEFIENIQDNYYGFDGLHDTNVEVPPCHVYKFNKEDLEYNEKENCILVNLGSYSNKKLDYLLKTLFVPMDELHFDLASYISKNGIRLVINNEIGNQDEKFYNTVYNFFDKANINPTYKGIWQDN